MAGWIVEIEEGQQLLFEKNEIEQAISTANQKKLLQVMDTPSGRNHYNPLSENRWTLQNGEEILTTSISLPPNMEEGIQIWYDYVQNFEDNKGKLYGVQKNTVIAGDK